MAGSSPSGGVPSLQHSLWQWLPFVAEMSADVEQEVEEQQEAEC